MGEKNTIPLLVHAYVGLLFFWDMMRERRKSPTFIASFFFVFSAVFEREVCVLGPLFLPSSEPVLLVGREVLAPVARLPGTHERGVRRAVVVRLVATLKIK